MNTALLRRFFHSTVERTGAPPIVSPVENLGIACIQLAGRPRPLLANIDECHVIEIFASEVELQTFLSEFARSPAASKVRSIARDIYFDRSGLLTAAALRNLFPSLQQTIIGSYSLAFEVTRRIVELCDPLFKRCAANEKKSPTSVRNLFCRRQHDLKRSARSRLNGWQTHSGELFELYSIKEKFIDAWIEHNQLTSLPHSTVSDVQLEDIARFIESKHDEVRACVQEVALLRYQKWLYDDVQKHNIKGPHSFAAARIAFITKYKKSPVTDGIIQ